MEEIEEGRKDMEGIKDMEGRKERYGKNKGRKEGRIWKE